MNKKLFLLILVFILGFLVRYWHITQIPPGLNRDEADIGYTAYSLIETGKDEYGKPWPISFKSFGDWKLPLYIYLTVPFVKIFGLTDFAVRFPSVLAGSMTIIVAYFLVWQFFRNKKMALLAALFFALSPWSIHLSRNGSESTTGVFFTVLGLLLYLKAESRKIYLLPAAIFLALPLYTYHGNHIFSLLFYISLTILFFKKYKSSKIYWLSFVLFSALSLFIFSKTLFSADKTKISGLFAAGSEAFVYEKVVTDRLQHSFFYPLRVILHNKIFLTILSFGQNYLKSYSPDFLFTTGGGNPQHNIPDFGNLYIWTAPFLVIGLSFLLIQRSEYKSLLLIWLLIAPVAASITKDAPHTNRMAPVLPLLEMIIAFGFVKTIQIIKTRGRLFSGLCLMGLSVLFVFNFVLWLDRYVVHFPLKRADIWGEGYTKLVSYIQGNTDLTTKEIVMSRPEYSPYIYFLFYNRTNPLQFQKEVIRYPETDEGFQHVYRFNNLTFRQIDWADDLVVPDRLYIDWSDQVPKSATDSSTFITEDVLAELSARKKDISDLNIGDEIISRKITDIKLQNNESMFTLIKTEKAQ